MLSFVSSKSFNNGIIHTTFYSQKYVLKMKITTYILAFKKYLSMLCQFLSMYVFHTFKTYDPAYEAFNSYETYITHKLFMLLLNNMFKDIIEKDQIINEAVLRPINIAK